MKCREKKEWKKTEHLRTVEQNQKMDQTCNFNTRRNKEQNRRDTWGNNGQEFSKINNIQHNTDQEAQDKYQKQNKTKHKYLWK